MQQPSRGRGRPPVESDAALVKVTVALPAAMIAACKRLGEGNLSLGLRRLYSGRYDQNAGYDQNEGEHGHTKMHEAEPVHTSAVSRRVPVVPRATQLPKSITSWED